MEQCQILHAPVFMNHRFLVKNKLFLPPLSFCPPLQRFKSMSTAIKYVAPCAATYYYFIVFHLVNQSSMDPSRGPSSFHFPNMPHLTVFLQLESGQGQKTISFLSMVVMVKKLSCFTASSLVPSVLTKLILENTAIFHKNSMTML